MTDRELTAVLVVRVWAEPGADELRARLTTVLDLAGGEGTSRTVAGRAAIAGAVEEWLDRIERSVTPP